MPAPRPQLTQDRVDAFIRDRCFAPSDTDRIGVELEWLTVDERHPDTPPRPERIRALLGDTDCLPGGSRVTFEPGGQLEFSSPPEATVGDACQTAADDL